MKLLYLLPKNILSRIVGWLMHQPVGVWAIRLFASVYRINISEAEKPIEQYKSIGNFFVRRLRAGARPLGNSPLVHPADSVISQISSIQNGQLVQAKGRLYSIQTLLDDEQAIAKYDQGLFATYYLCPTDYHRVHSPVQGQITAVSYLPGQLWPVNEWSVNSIADLFCRNERVVVEFSTEWGAIALVFVGATNVGKITLSFENQIVSNQNSAQKKKKIIYENPLFIEKGQELGMFHMGSTVVMCYPVTLRKQKPDHLWQEFLQKPVKMGENFL